MIIRLFFILGLCGLVITLPAAAQRSIPGEAVGKPLAILELFAGPIRDDGSEKIWVTEKGKPGEDQYFRDISRWRWGVGGHVLHLSHSVNGGIYSGETLVHYDHGEKAIVYRYAPSASFYTNGRMVPGNDGSIEVFETVHGQTGGISETHSIMRRDGAEMTVSTRYKKDGVWTEPNLMRYRALPRTESGQ